MSTPDNLDYSISKEAAREIMGATLLPVEYRLQALLEFSKNHGHWALITLFANFIGMANSVVANNREMIELLMITEGGHHPHDADKANLPTIFGALNGIALAEGIDQSKTCAGCAYRLGTPANQSPVTTCDADLVLQPFEPSFMCHEDLDEHGNPYRKCTGYTQAKKHRASICA